MLNITLTGQDIQQLIAAEIIDKREARKLLSETLDLPLASNG